jgi:hypothetical protein
VVGEGETGVVLLTTDGGATWSEIMNTGSSYDSLMTVSIGSICPSNSLLRSGCFSGFACFQVRMFGLLFTFHAHFVSDATCFGGESSFTALAPPPLSLSFACLISGAHAVVDVPVGSGRVAERSLLRGCRAHDQRPRRHLDHGHGKK